MEEEIRTVVDFSLYSLVLALHEQKGQHVTQRFIKNFK